MLYQRYRSPLYRYLNNRLSNTDDTDELFQDIWTSIIHGQFTHTGNASFRTWFYTVARNRLYDYYRKNRIGLASVEDVSEMVDTESPDIQLAHKQESKAFQRLVEQLPPRQLDVFLLKVESGLSLQEIAQVCGENLDTIKSRYRYAVNKLSQLLED